MKVGVNERELDLPEGIDLGHVRDQIKPEADVLVLNGFPVGPDKVLQEGDRVVLIKKGEIPTIDELECLMSSRHTPGVHGKLKRAVVGIAGLGGLGSHVATALARSGVGRLVIVDHDVVEPSNLNRQMYSLDHIGMKKVHALQHLLLSVNPFVEVDPVDITITRENANEVFRDCQIVVEAFDRPGSKTELIEALLLSRRDVRVVAASGVAGYGPANEVGTERLERLYICGDRTTEAKEGVGLMAPRVMVVAGHQANQVLRLLLGLDGQ